MDAKIRFFNSHVKWNSPAMIFSLGCLRKEPLKMDASRMQGKHQVTARRPLGTIFGFAFIVFYISFTIIAITRFPHTVSPLDMYLSTLGNAEISPDGAIFYNLGVILGGLAEIMFFIAIYAHSSPHGRRWVLIIGLMAGLINGW